jgi:hypothetical protein
MILALVFVSVLGCSKDDPGGAVDPYPAPDIALIDANKSSVTFGTQRTLAETDQAVVVVYFANFT